MSERRNRRLLNRSQAALFFGFWFIFTTFMYWHAPWPAPRDPLSSVNTVNIVLPNLNNVIMAVTIAILILAYGFAVTFLSLMFAFFTSLCAEGVSPPRAFWRALRETLGISRRSPDVLVLYSIAASLLVTFWKVLSNVDVYADSLLEKIFLSLGNSFLAAGFTTLLFELLRESGSIPSARIDSQALVKTNS